MDNIYDLINLRNKDIEKEIKKAIRSTNFSLSRLSRKQTCRIYAGYIYHSLKNEHITCQLISTKDDLDFSYDHYFVYVPKDSDNQYIVDLTYNQFGLVPEFKKMYKEGYMFLNNEEYDYYLKRIENVKSRRK